MIRQIPGCVSTFLEIPFRAERNEIANEWMEQEREAEADCNVFLVNVDVKRTQRRGWLAKLKKSWPFEEKSSI
jgi:hypothetical protein